LELSSSCRKELEEAEGKVEILLKQGAAVRNFVKGLRSFYGSKKFNRASGPVMCQA
jgi:hypothetical protein